MIKAVIFVIRIKIVLTILLTMIIMLCVIIMIIIGAREYAVRVIAPDCKTPEEETTFKCIAEFKDGTVLPLPLTPHEYAQSLQE